MFAFDTFAGKISGLGGAKNILNNIVNIAVDASPISKYAGTVNLDLNEPLLNKMIFRQVSPNRIRQRTMPSFLVNVIRPRKSPLKTAQPASLVFNVIMIVVMLAKR